MILGRPCRGRGVGAIVGVAGGVLPGGIAVDVGGDVGTGAAAVGVGAEVGIGNGKVEVPAGCRVEGRVAVRAGGGVASTIPVGLTVELIVEVGAILAHATPTEARHINRLKMQYLFIAPALLFLNLFTLTAVQADP